MPLACHVCPGSKPSNQDSAVAEDLAEGGAGGAAQSHADEAPRLGRRLRSADLLGRQGSAADGQEQEDKDGQGAEQGLRASLYDTIISHTRLLRSSSR